ncbi:uncharacterized protein LOC121262713 [Juglans microcarpa x Juglans regia]|uniref:uncharacterized protein LOC121262713 n=1 Tax=Juglans microcarpa x Juglans regia TaxID=2249226 RepID=UPI001B7E687E|nr:uncharacterized protein LOC121262713 [Juglans microcarpa x Juglans regia]
MVSRAREPPMEDFEGSDSSSSNSSKNSSAHSHQISNTFCAINMAKYLNLTDPSNQFRLDNGDNPTVVLVTDLLTSENYPTWSRAMKRALRAKNKICFITGSISPPIDPDDPLLDLWERCNDMVVSWLQNSISLSIRSSVAFVDNAHDLWLDLHDRFSHQNGPRIYQLKKTLASLQQDSDTTCYQYTSMLVENGEFVNPAVHKPTIGLHMLWQQGLDILLQQRTD